MSSIDDDARADATSTRISRRPSGGLDDVDRALVERLQTDGREGNRSLAAALGANEVTIANRLKRLEDAGIMRVVAVVDMAAFGRKEFVLLFLRVVGRPVADVAKDIAELDDVSAVTITTGRFDIVVTFLARDHAHIGSMLAGDLAAIGGLDVVRKELALEVLKYESKWAQLDPHADLALPLEPYGAIDELDIAIVKKLQADARQSNRRIAADLGVVEGTVRLRLKRLQEENAIRIQALSDVAAFGVGAHAYVGLDVQPGQLTEVSEALRSLPQVAVLIRSLGEFDYIAVVHAEDRRQLIEVVMNQIAATPGVRHTETMESFMTLKHTATWVRILP